MRPSPEQQKQIQMGALEALIRHVNVKKTDRTFIVDIDVWSYEPAKAAMLANAISKAYLAESKQSQAAAARRATTDLSGRLKELQERLRNAENALAIYKAQNNFVGTQDTLISDQQLSASNQRLAAARALTLDTQAKYDQIEAEPQDIGRRRRRSLRRCSRRPSPICARNMPKRGSARRNCTANWGRVIRRCARWSSRSQDLRRAINEEVERFAQSAKNDLTRARDYEASLNKALETQKRQSVQMSQASVRLRELEREVEASRDVYQSFLKRSRETEEQETLNTSSARVIGDATVPQRRTFPPAMSLLAMIGFVFGGLAAAGWFIAANQLMRRHEPGSAAGQSAGRNSAATGCSRRREAAACRPAPAATPASTRRQPDRKAADRPATGSRRDAHARQHPRNGQHRRRHAAGLADAARGLSADDCSQFAARDARGTGQTRRRRKPARGSRDRHGPGPGPQHRRAQHCACQPRATAPRCC